MAGFGPKKLQAKFLMGLGAIVLLLGIFFASSLYFHLSSLLDTQVKDKADLVFSQVSSVQGYVREILRPKMFATLPDDEFVIEAMSSSFISRAIMDRLGLTHSEYHYRRVAENARNPAFEIDDEERDLLNYFRTHESEAFWEGYRQVDGRDYFVKARPVRFKQSCLTCHGVPEDSPPVLLERYGAERGFGHALNDISGLVVVGVPVEGAVGQIREATFGYAALYGGGMLMFFGLVQMFFNRLIMTNLRRLSSKFKSLFQEEVELAVFEKLEQEDEIEEVVQGFEELADHVHAMNSQLRQHSENLEQMVQTRTSELKSEVDERRSDVKLFVSLLDGLNKSNSRREMWEIALPLVVERFHAEEGGFMCMFATQSYHSWPQGTSKPELPENWKDILVEVQPHYELNKAFIPVGASNTSSEGLLYLKWGEGTELKDQDRDVLRALGQQLGIALESLTALHNLLKQKDMLQGIVEGISNPLLLMDGNCRVVLANEAARDLAVSFGIEPSASCCQGLFEEGGILEECPLAPALVEGKTISRELETNDGRHFSISVFPVIEGTAGGGQGVVYLQDVTQEKQMLVSMQQSEKLATVGQLAAGLAHEMNNPLGVIKCYAELLKRAGEGHEVEPDAEVILKHATQAQNVLQDLLNFARHKPAEPVNMDIGKVVADSINVFRVQAEKKGVDVVPSVEADLPQLFANEQSVEQILANLLKNALDAVDPETGRIEVAAYREAEGFLALKVTDNGPGIPEGDRKKLFDPFFSTKGVGEGTGLGLAVVYGLVQDMGGSISVEDGDGAVFVVRLPVSDTTFSGGEA